MLQCLHLEELPTVVFQEPYVAASGKRAVAYRSQTPRPLLTCGWVAAVSPIPRLEQAVETVPPGLSHLILVAIY
jgi:hypothetical protein